MRTKIYKIYLLYTNLKYLFIYKIAFNYNINKIKSHLKKMKRKNFGKMHKSCAFVLKTLSFANRKSPSVNIFVYSIFS